MTARKDSDVTRPKRKGYRKKRNVLIIVTDNTNKVYNKEDHNER
jgi:hypothetical protein